MQESRETSRSGYQIIGVGLEPITNIDAFQEAMERVCEDAFTAIFQAQDAGTLKWKRSGISFDDLVTEAVIKNGRGESVVVPIILFTDVCCESASTFGFLTIGSKIDAPCRNTADPRVKRLFEQITGRAWKA